jgi:hypothetical protein
VSSADEGKMIIKEGELIDPQSKRNDRRGQHKCFGCFKEGSNLTHSVFLAVDSMKVIP